MRNKSRASKIVGYKRITVVACVRNVLAIFCFTTSIFHDWCNMRLRSVANEVLVVGQTPPPWHGQAVAVQALVDAEFEKVRLHLIRMDFSRDSEDVGRFQWRKLPRLPLLVIKIWRFQFRARCETLYYPPGGTTATAVLRDIFILLLCRPLFRRVVFHCHAGGFAEVAERTKIPIRWLARAAYSRPNVLIQLTEKSPPDGIAVNAKSVAIVPNGLPDDGIRYSPRFRSPSDSDAIRLLFVGAVSESKGVMVLLEACEILRASGVKFALRIVGRFKSADFERDCRDFIGTRNLENEIDLAGVLTGDLKWEAFCNSDIFCFPSHYEAENQPLVVLEAMEFGLPVVATDWRGISTMVSHGRTGFITGIRDPIAIAHCITVLASDPDLRARMGDAGRLTFCERYTSDNWRPAMESVLGGA
ncbi:glycosyltransferase family 4 protein [Mycobacterium sp. PSTR-4-N]|uniref:glycosyltransferase family 4 protein n=1 Tax=Mycobacterium sp. PSTR-4-N TaxID=2917745 RepID=UPI0035B4393B